ncbi:unnamed protein product [Oikopleura dioica]|uniref:Ras modification protein ERF4 n=1 Tax=Oikopleura dioica TaxID=34765 RepID=E4WWC9_OIKDI|nr:unnamed protein product [Oikopleura dioica]CBY34650.1 unnamed protein product [Oikopleura dioica]CBY36946.1 unnamed protein product [Oikopleura dioica]
MAHELHPLDGSQTEKYFILRDYSINDKIAFTFPNSASELPVPLRSYYTQLKDITTQMETIYSSAEAASTATYCQGCIACLTGYILLWCINTQYEKYQHEAEVLLEKENISTFKGSQIHIRNPCNNGLRCIEVIYPKC